MSVTSDFTCDTEAALSYDLQSGMPVFDDVVNGVAIKRMITADDLAIIPDSFPAFSCSILSYYKSNKASSWMRSYAVVRGRYIFLTRSARDQTPIRIIPLDQITFYMSGASSNEKTIESLGDRKDKDFSEFHMRVTGRRRSDEEEESSEVDHYIS